MDPVKQYTLLLFVLFYSTVFSINNKPSIHILPSQNGKNVIVKDVGAQFGLYCQFETENELPKGLEVQWQNEENRKINESSLQRVYAQLMDNKTVALYFNKIPIQDQGEYTCMAEFGETILENKIKIGVIRKAQFYDYNKTACAFVGDALQIDCTAFGHPNPTVTFRLKNGLVNENRISLKSGQLTIKPIKKEDDNLKVICLAAQTMPDFDYKYTKTKTVKIRVYYPDKNSAEDKISVNSFLFNVLNLLIVQLVFISPSQGGVE